MTSSKCTTSRRQVVGMVGMVGIFQAFAGEEIKIYVARGWNMPTVPTIPTKRGWRAGRPKRSTACFPVVAPVGCVLHSCMVHEDGGS